ncbi:MULTISPECIES: ABC transporter permease subunit [Treponema]|jgi:putative aldouronate transport system permease protein|uniref:Putative aldouronate transport system permease protein n=1 Tax=Treponema rectale TaxID=744512 RepID=A0A840SEB3_9SPIR|nr:MULTISPECIES: ABC transporter permease subunit [Treponema]MBB5217812.1 putative aldouronate transport system permease protein [Treponema rectale]MBE6353674.1 sugar ABC transporter permease [Treponema sp.]MBO6176875.1 sugar ABC transporter permease [Treponema sp.]QOS40461.1 sugar ABC transporter permease [Treponema rectale]
MEKVQTEVKLKSPLRKRTFWKRLQDESYLQLMAWLGIIWMLVFNYAPMYGLLVAFKSRYMPTTPLFSSEFLSLPWAKNGGFEHFIAFFKDEEFKNVMLNTLGISILKLCICFPLPIFFAILLNEVRNPKFKKTVQTISYLPHFLSWVVLGGILTNWMDVQGLFNQLLMNMGLLKEPVYFLAEPKYFWGIVVLSDLWKEIGWSAIIYLAAISGIDQEMYEAAEVDGAGRLRQIFSITLPSIKGTIVIMFILAVGGLLNSNFDQIFVLRNPLNDVRSNVIDIYTYKIGLGTIGRLSYASAVGLFKSVVAFILLFIANNVTKKLNDTSLF